MGLVALLWYFLNAASTLYTMQHYGVDILLGNVVGISAVIIVRFLLTQEQKNKLHHFDIPIPIPAAKIRKHLHIDP